MIKTTRRMPVFNISEFSKNFHPSKLLLNERMSSHTTFRIGGPATIMLLPHSTEDIALALDIANHISAPAFIIGGGSNLLVNDNGLHAIIIKLSKDFAQINHSGETITAQPGASLASLAAFALQHNLTGLEFAAGIPGTLGGAIYMNAGAYGSEMSGVVQSAKLLQQGKVTTHTNSQLGFSYRTSHLQTSGNTVLEATLTLHQGDPTQITAEMHNLAKQRREKQPLEYPSAGSTFKRPPGQFAGKLIEDAGLKGHIIGGAQVSHKHAGFIINTGNATAKDVTNLIEYVQNEVYKLFHIELEPEVRII